MWELPTVFGEPTIRQKNEVGSPTKQGFWVSIYAHTRIKTEHEPLLIHTLKNFTSHAYIASHALYIYIYTYITYIRHIFTTEFFRGKMFNLASSISFQLPTFICALVFAKNNNEMTTLIHFGPDSQCNHLVSDYGFKTILTGVKKSRTTKIALNRKKKNGPWSWG